MTAKPPADTATAIAELTLKQLREMKIPATPHNFTIWYHYLSDSHPGLKSTVDALQGGQTGLNEAHFLEIHERFFSMSEENSAVTEATEKLDQILDQANQYLSEAGTDAQEFSDALTGRSDSLNKAKDRDAAVTIIREIVEASREMGARTKTLEVRLAESSAEVSVLKEEIEAARREASTDGLTGLANRKLFDIAIRQETANALEVSEPLCLLMVDIDHFKNFNDTYGHTVGDQVLRVLGGILSQSIKGRDTAARYGGEEFSVILPGTALNSAKAVAEFIRERIAQKNIINRATGEALGNITLSIGVAAYRPGESMEKFISRADEALYAAKNSGRNRVCTENDLAKKAAAG